MALGRDHIRRVTFLDDVDGGLVVGVGVTFNEGVDGEGGGFVEGDGAGAEGDEGGEEEGGEDGFHGAVLGGVFFFAVVELGEIWVWGG